MGITCVGPFAVVIVMDTVLIKLGVLQQYTEKETGSGYRMMCISQTVVNRNLFKVQIHGGYCRRITFHSSVFGFLKLLLLQKMQIPYLRS